MKIKRFVRGLVIVVRGIAIVVLAIGVLGVVLYLLGLRIVMDGGAGINFAFVKSAEAQAEEIARHRAAQRAQLTTPPPAAAPAAPSHPRLRPQFRLPLRRLRPRPLCLPRTGRSFAARAGKDTTINSRSAPTGHRAA
jgi:hypothetical protein